MTTTPKSTQPVLEAPAVPVPSGMLLAAAVDTHRALATLEADEFRLASEWVLAHPGAMPDYSVSWEMRDLEIAGDGAPTIAEEAIAEYALAMGRSTDSGRAYLGDAVECRFRLPKLWARVMAGEVAVWKARRITAKTHHLPVEGAAFVDTHLAPAAATCSFAQIERTTEEALLRFDPVEAEKRRVAAAEGRDVRVFMDQVSSEGLVDISGSLDLNDAACLDEALVEGAKQLADLGSEAPLGVRRSQALGLIARHALTGQDALDLSTETPAGPEVVLYVHLDEDTQADGDGATGLDVVAHVENTRTAVGVNQVKEWCQQAGTTVTVRPVIDLNADLHTNSYTPTDLQREQAVLTYWVCCFPGCDRPARNADLDHIVEHPDGPTDSSNLESLCRGHHRLKTFTDWTIRRLDAVTFEWTSPMGKVYLHHLTGPVFRRRRAN